MYVNTAHIGPTSELNTPPPPLPLSPLPSPPQPEMAAAPQEKEPLTATEPEAIEMQDNISPSSQANGIPPAAPNQPTQKLKAILQSRQFPRGDLLLVEKIGEGEYGPIYRGEAYNLGVKDESRAVAVKMLAPIEGAEVNPNLQLFQEDIEMLMSVNHLNVVGMLAVCTQDSPECILLDTGLPGDLLKFIHGKKEQRLSTLAAPQDDSVELLKIGEEIALGMVYLSSEHFVHKDLALRNCIIGYDGVVKVAHFGLGPVLHPEAYYRVSGNDFPVRWMPPESIVSGNFTTMSDIWAFGVLLWELFTYGDLPYTQMDNEEMIGFVTKEFGRLSRPDGCPDDVFSIMTSCWAFESHMRPTFAILQEQIADLISLERESPSIMESVSPARSPDLPAPLY